MRGIVIERSSICTVQYTPLPSGCRILLAEPEEGTVNIKVLTDYSRYLHDDNDTVDHSVGSGRRSGDGRRSGPDPILQHCASELRSCVSCLTYKSGEHKAATGPQERVTACSCAISKAAMRAKVPESVATGAMRPFSRTSSLLLVRCPPLALCHAIHAKAEMTR
jgi:hypothetical protein